LSIARREINRVSSFWRDIIPKGVHKPGEMSA
jgi:hypothetical protein